MAAAKKESTNYERLLNQSKNKGLIAIIILILAGYLFFAMSPVIFHERPDKQLSEIHESFDYANGNMTLDKWVYSKEQQMFEICCSFSKNVIISDISIKSSCNYTYKTKGTGLLTPQIAYLTTDYLVLFVSDIPDDWYCSAISISDGKGESDSDNECTIYTCVDDVEKTESIKTERTDKEFQIERCERSIDYLETIIESNENEISECQEEIKEKEENIKILNSEKVYQVSDELKATNEKIASLEADITADKKRIGDLKIKNVELNQKIQEYRDLILEIKGG